MRVFIVDDSEIVRERLTTMLSALRPSVELVGEAGDPIEATEAILKLMPDVVILDIRMPRRSGIEVLRDLKRAEPAPVVVMLTNYPYKQYRDTCREAGAEFFLDKSTEFDKVPEVFQQLSRA